MFFDYNGNGKQDNGEPAVSGAKVQLKNTLGNVVADAVTDSVGAFKLEDLPVDDYRLLPIADSKFDYMCTSPSELVSIGDGYAIPLSEGTIDLNIGLMEGFLTLPLTSKTDYTIASYYDRDPDPATYLWWNGEQGLSCELKPGNYCNYNHPGIDYEMKMGETLVAQAPGLVYKTGSDSGGPYMFILHPNGLVTGHGHFSKPLVSEGATVQRGQPVALSGAEGPTGTIPHDHVSLIYGPSRRYAIDAYAPEFKMTEQYSGYYDMISVLKDGNFQWITLPVNDQNPNLNSYWTKSNDPQFALT